MLIVRNILVALICASPVILAWDGLIAQGVVAGIVAVALTVMSRTMRPGETEFLISIVRTPLVAAAVPVLWVLLQVLPLQMLSHPIWTSAQQALGHPLRGAISVDPSASLIALGQYLTMCAVAFLSAAVAVDRRRAEWILFALTGAAAAIALIALTHDFLSGDIGLLSSFSRTPAIACVGVGIIIAGAACIRMIERHEKSHSRPEQPISILFWTFAVSSAAALAISVAALAVGAMYWMIFASGCGLAALVFAWVIRRFGLGPLAATAIVAPALAVVILVVADHQRGPSVAFAFAKPSASLTTLSQHMLDDAPLLGTGAGTFAALAPIYRGINQPLPGPVAATTAATLAIELGQPMLWLITVATAAAILYLLRASLRRGRDAFYPAMGAGCLTAVLLFAFANAGLSGTAPELILAAALGLAVAQSRSRTV